MDMDAIVQHRRKIVLEMHKIGCEIQRLMGKVITEELNLRIWTSCQNWEENCFNRFGNDVYAQGYQHHVRRKIGQLKKSLSDTQQRIANNEQQNLQEQRRQEAAMLEMEKRKRERERKMRLENEKRIRRQKRLEEQKRLQAAALAEKKRREEMQQRQALKQQQIDQAYLQYESRRKQMSQNYLQLLRGIKAKLTARNDPQDMPKLKFIATAEKVLMSPAVKDLAKLRNGEINLNKLEVPLSNLKRSFQQRQMQQRMQQKQRMQQRQMEAREMQKRMMQQSQAHSQPPAPKRRRNQSSQPRPAQQRHLSQQHPTQHQPVQRQPLLREPSADSVIILDDPDEPIPLQPVKEASKSRGKGKDRGRAREVLDQPLPSKPMKPQPLMPTSDQKINVAKDIEKVQVDITKPEKTEPVPAVPLQTEVDVKPSYAINPAALDEASTPLLNFLKNGEQNDDGFGLFSDLEVHATTKDTSLLKLPSAGNYEEASNFAFEALSDYSIF